MTPIPHKQTGNLLKATLEPMGPDLYSILLPKETQFWAVSDATYGLGTGTVRVTMWLDAPLPGTLEPIGPDTRFTLRRLLEGRALVAESPESAGGIQLSQPQMDSPVAMEQEHTLYLRLEGTLKNFQSTITLGETSLPDRVKGYLRNDGGFTQQSVDDLAGMGENWDALCRAFRGAELKGPR